ncbi:Gldg family protein [Marinicella sp. W31]|uniref:Gldg family protein n=1 Tax=Marinicella sp. W31 TaxID=3023713 RepID=UPI003757568A
MKNQTNTTKLILVAAIFLLVSVIVSNSGIFSRLRLDLTENDLFTLNPGTKNILKNIDEQVHLKLFYSDEATRDIAMLRTYFRRVKDFLEELERYAGGNLKISVIDPVSFSEEEDQASQYGLQSLPVGEGGENVFFGIAGTNALDDVEVLPFLQPDREAFLEYDVAQMIYNLNNPKKRVIGVMSDMPLLGSFDPQSGRQIPGQIVFEQLQKIYAVKSVATNVDSIEEVDLLMVVHPKALSEQTQFAIDQYVMDGGRLVVFVDPMAQSQEVPNDPQNPMAQIQADRSSDLSQLFNAWGVQFNKSQVVLDAPSSVSIQSGQSGQPIRHLGIVSWKRNSLNQEDIVAADLEAINMSIAGYFTASDESKLTPIVVSSQESATSEAQPMVMLYNPTSLLNTFQPDDRQYTVAARINGPIESAFKQGIDGVTASSVIAEQSNPQVVVFADVDLLFNQMWVRAQNFFGRQIYSNFADNGSLLINLADNMTGSADLIKIRAREVSARPFDKVMEIQRESEQKYRETENQLLQQLRETESKLNELQRSKDQDNLLILSREQEDELSRFKQRKLEVRKRLREVKRNLNKDIESLGSRMKFINIALIPILLSLIAVFFSWRKSKRKERKYVK